jgi:hypothetical protein
MEETRKNISETQACPPEEREKYRRLYEITRDSFNEQFNRFDSFDRKAQINLIVIGIVLGFGFYKVESMSELISGVRAKGVFNSPEAISLALSFAFFVVSFMLSVLVLLLKRMRIHPNVKDVMKKFEDKEIQDLDASMVVSLQDSIDENEKSLESKAATITNAFRSILIAFSLGIVFLVLTILSKAFNF